MMSLLLRAGSNSTRWEMQTPAKNAPVVLGFSYQFISSIRDSQQTSGTEHCRVYRLYQNSNNQNLQ